MKSDWRQAALPTQTTSMPSVLKRKNLKKKTAAIANSDVLESTLCRGTIIGVKYLRCSTGNLIETFSIPLQVVAPVNETFGNTLQQTRQK